MEHIQVQRNVSHWITYSVYIRQWRNMVSLPHLALGTWTNLFERWQIQDLNVLDHHIFAIRY